jgi:Zn-dependent protease
MFSEPPRTQGDLNFRLLGMPVRIHPWFWLIAVMLGLPWQEPVLVLLWVVATFVCILIHELGHALVLRAYGYHPWIVLYGLGGLTIHEPNQAFARRPGPWGQIGISFAGPLIGFVLTAVLLLGFYAAGRGDHIIYVDPLGLRLPLIPILISLPGHEFVRLFLCFVFRISVFWGLVNLLPIYPLDGGQIAQQLFLLTGRRDAIQQSLILSTVMAAVMAGVAAIRWESLWTAVFFGWLAYSSYTMLQEYQRRGPW